MKTLCVTEQAWFESWRRTLAWQHRHIFGRQVLDCSEFPHQLRTTINFYRCFLQEVVLVFSVFSFLNAYAWNWRLSQGGHSKWTKQNALFKGMFKKGARSHTTRLSPGKVFIVFSFIRRWYRALLQQTICLELSPSYHQGYHILQHASGRCSNMVMNVV